MIKTLCGASTYKNVVILTTLWDTVSLRQGELQETQVRLNILQWLIQDGATFMRHDRTLSSAQRVLDYIFTLVPKIRSQSASLVPETGPQTQSSSSVLKHNDRILGAGVTREYFVSPQLETFSRQGTPKAVEIGRPSLLPGWRKGGEEETLDIGVFRDQFASPRFETLDRWGSPRAAEVGRPPASTVFEPSGQNPTISQLFQTSHETVREKELIAEINVLKDSNSELKRELEADAEKMQENQEKWQKDKDSLTKLGEKVAVAYAEMKTLKNSNSELKRMLAAEQVERQQNQAQWDKVLIAKLEVELDEMDASDNSNFQFQQELAAAKEEMQQMQAKWQKDRDLIAKLGDELTRAHAEMNALRNSSSELERERTAGVVVWEKDKDLITKLKEELERVRVEMNSLKNSSSELERERAADKVEWKEDKDFVTKLKDELSRVRAEMVVSKNSNSESRRELAANEEELEKGKTNLEAERKARQNLEKQRRNYIAWIRELEFQSAGSVLNSTMDSNTKLNTVTLQQFFASMKNMFHICVGL